jgi:uncharacterized protein with PIN domain
MESFRVSPNLNDRCLNSIRKEKVEIAKRYNIKFGQTEVYCERCHRPCWPGRHTCKDIRLKRLNEAKNIRTPIPGQVYESNVCSIV